VASTVTARAPAWADGVAVSGAEMRAAIGGSIYSSAGFVRGLVATQIPTPAMQVRLTAGMSVIADGQNGYLPIELAAQTDLDVTASSPTLPRIDSLIAEFVDNGASSLYRYRVVAGTPNASPVQPTLPYADQPTGKCLRLYNIAVAAAATSIVTANISVQFGLAQLAAVTGRVSNVASDGGRPSSPGTSERIWRTDKLCYETWTGSAWVEDYVSTVGPAWKTYTPTWTSTGTAPSLGNGTAVGHYMKIGRTVHVAAEVILGSTSTVGTGTYRFSLPFNAVTLPEQFVLMRYYDSSAATAYVGQGALSSGTYFLPQQIASVAGALVTMSATSPVVPAQSDQYMFCGTYEATS
jgi:hypothetical protein